MEYAGTELELFEHARNWKSYVRSTLDAHLAGRVLEVGAGIGAVTEAFCGGGDRWWSLEPNQRLLDEIARKQRVGRIPASVRLVKGTIADLDRSLSFDTILYMDVLEHILDDTAEVRNAAERLHAGGRLIILAPAFPSVYSPFDAAIGHHRRYTRAALEQIRPSALLADASFYLDAPGLMLSWANRLMLRRARPARSQIAFWDKLIVPVARVVDPLVGYRFGRSVVVIWRAP